MKYLIYLFSTGAIRGLTGFPAWLVVAVSALTTVWVIYATCLVITNLFGYTIIFLTILLALTFLIVDWHSEITSPAPPVYDWVLAAASMACGIYFVFSLDRIVTRISILDQLTTLDLTFGTILLLLTIEATRRTTGLGLTAIVVVLIAYNLWGHNFEGALSHSRIDYAYFLDLTVFTTDGIFGAPIRVAATYAFLFILFGVFLDRAGGGDFFYNLGAWMTGRQIGGTAKISVFSSGLFGMISGSPTSDVVTTGAVTIPLMRRSGYPRTVAGAVEVVASSGGSIMPPVMGATAFVMAEFTGIPYWEIALAALVPAALYYVGIFTQIHLRSSRLGIKGIDRSELPPFSSAIRSCPIFVVPLFVIVFMLKLGYTPTLVALVATGSVLVVSIFMKPEVFRPRIFVESLSLVTRRVVPVTAACAAAGLVIGGLGMTGLTGKVALLIEFMTGGIPLLYFIVAGVFTILLGMGMPTVSAFVLASVLLGPGLREMGMSLLSSNMFLLYFSALSAITPPIAVAAYAAASIAEGNPLHIAAVATRLAASAFVLPFAFAYGPELLLVGGPFEIAFAIFTALLGVVALAFAVEGWADRQLSWVARLLLAIAGLGFIASSYMAFAVGCVILAAIMLKWRMGQEASVRSVPQAPED